MWIAAWTALALTAGGIITWLSGAWIGGVGRPGGSQPSSALSIAKPISFQIRPVE